MSFVMLLVFMAGAVIAMPIAHALLMGAMAAAATSDRVPLDLLVQQMVAQVQSFPLIAIPFFMLTGSTPKSTSFWRTAGSLMDATTCLCRAAMTGAGVLAGATSPT
ncbi:TRAP transporter large permease subunit, partial [Delftia tsuruhatensis]|uniref:TRAP transporter large permease subunit n=1 Tax=Delftia tsuruhatensis TaxID=180282 RepID=UPI0031B88736